jgi:Ca2+/Na+ antiporter
MSLGSNRFNVKVGLKITSTIQLMTIMKNKYDTLFMFTITLITFVLMLSSLAKSKKIKELETRMDELTVIVNQKYLPAMILDDLKVR